VARNITIAIDDELAHWARRKAADGNTSVSKLIGGLLEREMHASDQYWRACEAWKNRGVEPGLKVDPYRPLNRAEIHARR
jgi:hypothetical protein